MGCCRYWGYWVVLVAKKEYCGILHDMAGRRIQGHCRVQVTEVYRAPQVIGYCSNSQYTAVLHSKPIIP